MSIAAPREHGPVLHIGIDIDDAMGDFAGLKASVAKQQYGLDIIPGAIEWEALVPTMLSTVEHLTLLETVNTEPE